MKTDELSDAELQLAARALSIHRVSMRRKLDRLHRGTSEYGATLKEVADTQHLIEKLNNQDLVRMSNNKVS